jgi:tetratricopeptide (TPR) repeat protein
VGAYLSLFAPDVISWKFVESATDLLNCPESEINEAKKQLYKRYLIERLEEKEACYKIHPLIREFLKAKLAALENTDDLRRNFAAVFIKIAQQIPETITVEDIKSVQDAIPHLTEVAQNLIDAVSDEDLIWVFTGLGRFYNGQGLYAIAEPWYNQCVEVVKTRLGASACINIVLGRNSIASRRIGIASTCINIASTCINIVLGRIGIASACIGIASTCINIAGHYQI